jgi:hypothetical protein
MRTAEIHEAENVADTVAETDRDSNRVGLAVMDVDDEMAGVVDGVAVVEEEGVGDMEHVSDGDHLLLVDVPVLVIISETVREGDAVAVVEALIEWVCEGVSVASPVIDVVLLEPQISPCFWHRQPSAVPSATAAQSPDARITSTSSLAAVSAGSPAAKLHASRQTPLAADLVVKATAPALAPVRHRYIVSLKLFAPSM